MKRIVTIILIAAATIIASRSLAIAGECNSGEWKCSDDGYTLNSCESGAWKTSECMKDQGKLCEAGSCVDPWRYGSPKWPRAEDEQLRTKETLAEKEKFYDAMAERLFLHPNLKWTMGVVLPCDKTSCGNDCKNCALSSIPQETATWKDVIEWQTGENDGLFSSLLLASEAFRYAVTKDPDALKIIKTMLEAEVTRLKITGVPGLFTRQFIPPGVPGIKCPEDLESYVPSGDKTNNMWVKVNDDGCVWNVDGKTMKWVASKHCGLKEYAGYCWLDNVSKDEYAGHMFTLGALAKLVDDPGVQATVKGLLQEVGDNMYNNKLEFIDWDGRTTEHGQINAVTFGDYPGFNAAMSLDFVKVAAEATGDPKLKNFYDNCLLQKKGRVNCLKKAWETPKPYTSYLRLNGMFPGYQGCGANFNNISMHMLSMHNLIWFERDPKLKETYQHNFDVDVMRAKDQPRAIINQNNAWFDIMWAAQKRLGPGSDGPAYDAVDNAVRMLRQFPARKNPVDKSCPPDVCKPFCSSRFEEPEGDHPRTVAERCMSHFIWWGDPYGLGSCKLNTRYLEPPSDYLLPYWMARYYGFISADM